VSASPAAGALLRSVLLGLALVCSAEGGAAAAHEDLHERIAAVGREIARDPARVDLYVKRGELHRLHRDWALARADIEHAGRLDARAAGLDLLRARLYVDLERFDAAFVVVDRILDERPRDLDALALRATLAVRRARYAAALRDFERLLEIASPPRPELYLARAAALLAESPADLARAVASLDQGIAALGDLPSLQLRAIELERARGRADAALERLGRVARRSARQERWLAERGEILLEAGREAEARDAFEGALRAVAGLPAGPRETRAVRELAQRVKARLAELDS